MFERLNALLAQSSGAKVFPVRRIAPEWIEDAERELGLPLASTYRCLLQTYGWQLPGLQALRPGAPRSRGRRPHLLPQVGCGRRRSAKRIDRIALTGHG